MTKNKTPFEKINIPDEAMETVGEFKAIVAPGKKRPLLDKDQHKMLVKRKYQDGANTSNHSTLFRIQDKKTLPLKEIKEHTVPGPNWTPPSSVGYVVGTLSHENRVWLATKPTNDNTGLLDNKGNPAIYARELTAATIHGWSARETREEECYGKTKKQPALVLTPPSSPKPTSTGVLQVLMDVKASWDQFPFSVDELKQKLTPISLLLSDFLKANKLHRENFNEKSLKIIEVLVKNKLLPEAIKIKLLQDQEIIDLLTEEMLELEDLIRIYIEYLETTNSTFGEFNFNEMYNLINTHKQEFEHLVLGLNLTIQDVIELYKTNQKMFFDFADNNSVLFYEKYSQNISIQELRDLYTYSEELYWLVINDPDKLIENKDVYLAINLYQVLYKLPDMDVKDDDEFEDQEYSDMDPDEYNPIPAQLDMLLSGDMYDSEDEFL